MDALIYGYSNFTFTPPTGTTTTAVRSEVANAPMTFDDSGNRFTSTPVFITPTLETVKPDAIPTVTPIYEDDVRRLAPIRPEVSPSPFVIPDDVRPPAPTPSPSPFIPIIDIIDTKPTYVKPDAIPTVTPIYEDDVRRLAPIRPEVSPSPFVIPDETVDKRTIMDSVPYHEAISYQSAPISIAEDDGRRTVAPTPSPFTPVSISEKDQDRNVTPIINIISPSPYVAPALNTEVGGALGGGTLGGGSMGGGGGAMATPRKPLYGSVATKPSFLKRNFIPLVLVATAIFVFIKKPIK